MSDERAPRPAWPEPEWSGNGGSQPVRWPEPEEVWHDRQGPLWTGPEPVLAPERRGRVGFHVVLLVLTIASTWLAGGPVFSAAIMLILFAHEMGHYLACRHYGVEATLPFFIPMPISPFGTMGAVIRMRGRIPSRKALFDIAAAGPIAGLVFALPAVIVGLRLSHIAPLPPEGSGLIFLGESPLFRFLSRVIVGETPAGTDVVIHPLGFAGWAGLFVTALNLLPIGQLDGGHIIYSLLGPRARWVSLAIFGAFAVASLFLFWHYTLLIALLLLFGLRHPPPVDDVTRIGMWRSLIAILLIILFALSFTPEPMHL